jgi:hypothetical protein
LFPIPNFSTGVKADFQVCALGLFQPLGCGVGILGDPEISSMQEPSTVQQDRQWLEARNGDCVGLRMMTGSSSCGAGDVEFNPSISDEGTLQVEGIALNGGIIDLGPQPLTGTLELPQAGYGMRVAIEPGRLYAVKSGPGYALLYVGQVRSDLDPRLASRRAMEGVSMLADSLDGITFDTMADTMLNRARVTIDLQWAASERSRDINYSFSAAPVERVQPGIFARRPRG